MSFVTIVKRNANPAFSRHEIFMSFYERSAAEILSYSTQVLTKPSTQLDSEARHFYLHFEKQKLP